MGWILERDLLGFGQEGLGLEGARDGAFAKLEIVTGEKIPFRSLAGVCRTSAKDARKKAHQQLEVPDLHS